MEELIRKEKWGGRAHKEGEVGGRADKEGEVGWKSS